MASSMRSARAGARRRAPRRGLKVIYLNPRRILPPHEVRRHGHLRELVVLMRRSGWQGRPLLVEKLAGGRHFFAWTGTHRLAAAKAAGLRQIPCVLVNRGRAPKVLPQGASTTSDVSRLRALSTRRDPAAALMRAEIRINRDADRRGVL